MTDEEHDENEKLATLPTPRRRRDKGEEEQSADNYVVDLGGSYVHYHRGLDGKMRSSEYLAEELISDEDVSPEDVRKTKTIDLDAILAVQDADKDVVRAVKTPDSVASKQEDAQPTLRFTKPELDRYEAIRKTGLAKKSLDWIGRASKDIWDVTKGEISQTSMTGLMNSTLKNYSSIISRRKVIGFMKAFLKHLGVTRFDPGTYQAFAAYLELPKAVKVRGMVTERIIRREDIFEVLRRIDVAERKGSASAPEEHTYDGCACSHAR